MSTEAGWPRRSAGMSVWSTSSTASIVDMSEIVMSTVPALFMVPVTTTSPCSMLRRVTTPSMGVRISVLASESRDDARSALACSTCRAARRELASACSARLRARS